jgi:hypothetical protein
METEFLPKIAMSIHAYGAEYKSALTELRGNKQHTANAVSLVQDGEQA